VPCRQGTLATYPVQQKKSSVLYSCQRFEAFLGRPATRGRASGRERPFDGGAAGQAIHRAGSGGRGAETGTRCGGAGRFIGQRLPFCSCRNARVFCSHGFQPVEGERRTTPVSLSPSPFEGRLNGVQSPRWGLDKRKRECGAGGGPRVETRGYRTVAPDGAGGKAPAAAVPGCRFPPLLLSLAAPNNTRPPRRTAKCCSASPFAVPVPDACSRRWALAVTNLVASVPSCLRPYVPLRAASLRASIPASLCVAAPAVLAVSVRFPVAASRFPPFARCT